jgi:hypothetical protein
VLEITLVLKTAKINRKMKVIMGAAMELVHILFSVFCTDIINVASKTSNFRSFEFLMEKLHCTELLYP